MIRSVMFDMGGTLEDIFVDSVSEHAAISKVDEMLRGWGFTVEPGMGELKNIIDDGWKRYGVYRDASDVELKPVDIWCGYVLKPLGLPEEELIPHCEELAHMWEVTHYHRAVRPRVKEMLEGLKGLGLKLGIISNTAALYQVFDSLEEYGIRDYFSDVTLSSVTGMRKPCGDIFKVSLRQLQTEASESVYVGDTVSRDIIGSKRAGFAAAIQICSKLTKEKDAGVRGGLEPDYLISDIYDVYPIVKGIIEK